MNFVLIAVLAILAIGAVIGWKKGFVEMLFGAISMILALALAVIFAPKLSAVLQENETIMGKLTVKVSEVLNLDELVVEVPDAERLVDNLNLPNAIKETIVSAEFMEKLELDTLAEDATSKMADAVAALLAKIIITAVCFVVAFVVALLLLYLLNKLLDVVAKLPVLKQANQLAGLALGLCQSILVIWMFFAVITMVGGSEFGQTMFAYISDSNVLDFLYKNNVPMNYITKTAANLF